MERILVQRIGPSQNVGKKLFLPVEIALQHGLGERTLVAKMIKEAAFRNADARDQLLDRGRRETLLQDRRLGERENPLAGVGVAWCRDRFHGLALPLPLYWRSSRG